MLIRDGTGKPADAAGVGRRVPHRCSRRLATITLAVLALVCAVTARLLVWPAQGMAAHVSAIVMLAGPGDRLTAALRLASARRASMLVISRGHDGYGSPCPARPPGVTLICFEPNPATTRGEAEAVGRLARRYHWQSVALVTTRAQDTRARIRTGRCFHGEIYVAPVSQPWYDWPYQIAYEWGALAKALVTQRPCLGAGPARCGAGLAVRPDSGRHDRLRLYGGQAHDAVGILLVRACLPFLPAHHVAFLMNHETPRTIIPVMREAIALIKGYVIFD